MTIHELHPSDHNADIITGINFGGHEVESAPIDPLIAGLGRLRLEGLSDYMVRRGLITTMITTYGGHPEVALALEEYRNPNSNGTPDEAGYLDHYISDVYEYPLLTEEDEQGLFGIIDKSVEALGRIEHTGRRRKTDEAQLIEGTIAFQKVILSNLPLVISIARKYNLPKGIQLNDVIEEGNIGLMEAAYRFDIKRGLKFSTPATKWIESTIGKALAAKTRVIRIPHGVHEKAISYRTTMSELVIDLGRDPTDEEIEEHFGVSAEVVKETMSFFNDLADESLDEELSGEGTNTLLDVTPDLDEGVEQGSADYRIQRFVSELFTQNTIPALGALILSLNMGAPIEALYGTEYVGANGEFLTYEDFITIDKQGRVAKTGINRFAEMLGIGNRGVTEIKNETLAMILKAGLPGDILD
jgi:RNA polymerase sigma factor (sigma-70 family)